MLDLIEDFIFEIPEAAAKYVPWPFSGLAKLTAIVVCGTFFTILLAVFAAVGIVLSPLLLVLAVYNWWRS